MAHLDCENPETALDSIAHIYDAAPNEIRRFFSTFDIDEHYERNRPELSGDDEARRILELHFGEPKNNVNRTYWFHLSRTELGARFESGIHPLNFALPNIWSMLIRIVRNTHHAERLEAMQVKGVKNFQYNFKTPDPLHWGPYAMLVKEIGSHAAAVSNHDYLKLPEIIEDICLGYEEQFGEDIQPTIENALRTR